MTHANSKQFLRPTILVVFSLAVSMALALAISSYFPVATHLEPFDELVDRVSGLQQPSKDLSPEEVVRIQLDAVTDDDWGRGAMQCMYFASPANRVITGPFERFGRMLRSPPFQVFSNPDQVLVGNATII